MGMGVHVAARLPCARACDCARRRCGRCHHVRAWVRLPGYIANAHVSAIHLWNTHIHSVCIHHACMYLHPCASGYTDERIAGAGPPHTRGHVLRPCARACVRVVCDWAPTHPRRHVRAPCVGLDRGWLGSQAFAVAIAFNANIGAWNTASVSNMQEVCAAFPAWRRATAGGTRSAGHRCGAGRCARGDRRCARSRVCADVWARACAGVHVCRYSCA
jgi:hypothetical protein